jgi:transposase
MGAVFVGVDVGKKTHSWCIVSSPLLKQYKRYQRCPQGSIKNEREGFDSLLVRARKEAGNGSTIHVLCEHTGHYGYGFEQYLQEQPGVRVYRALAAKRFARDKTDKKDSQGLAVRLYNQVGLQAPVTDEAERVTPLRKPTTIAAQLKPLVQRRVELTRALTRVRNRLTAMTDQLFPEFTQIYADPNGASALNLREKYPTAHAIAEASLKELIATRTYTRPGNAAFVKLQELAKQTIGLKEGAREHSLLIEQGQLIEEIRMLQQQEVVLDCKIEEILVGSREAQILSSFPGINTTLAAMIIASIGNIGNFATLARFRSYVGWAPNRRQTGTSYDNTRTDRAGNRIAKLAMRQAAVCVIGHSTRWAALYNRLSSGPHASGAMGRVTGQLAGVIYLLLKQDADLIARSAGAVLLPPQLYDSSRHG